MTFPSFGGVVTRQRRVAPAPGSEPYVYGRSNEYDQDLVAQGLPPYTEMTRQGVRWKAFTITPFAPIAAFPTTLANLEIANNTAGFNFVVDSIWAYQLLGTAATQVITPWAMAHVTVFSGNTALVVSSGNGSPQYASTANTPLKTAITQTVVANGWEVFPGSTSIFATAAATPGGVVTGQVDGRLVIKNGFSLMVCCTGSLATASSVQVGAAGWLVAISNSF